MMLKDPVCGKRIHRNHAHAHIEYEGFIYYLCCPVCQAEFQAAPERWAWPELGEKVKALHKSAHIRFGRTYPD